MSSEATQDLSTVEEAEAQAERDAAAGSSRFRPSAGGWAARYAVALAFIAGIFALPAIVPFEYQAELVALAAIYACVGLSMNVLVGYLGQLSLGHQAFFGIGAFASAILVTLNGYPFPLGLAAGLATGAISALLLGYVALRVKGLYLAIVTLAYGTLAEVSIFRFGFLAAGVDATRPAYLSSPRIYAYVCLGILTLLFAFDWRLMKSKAGRAIQAIRDDERVAASFGINITGYKLLAFIISGSFAGLAGALFGHLVEAVSSENEFDLALALTFVLMTVVGGLGNRVGVIIGSIIFAVLDNLLELLHEALPFFPEVNPLYVPLIGAALLVITLIQFPGGIGQQIAPIQNWVRGGRFDIHAMHKKSAGEVGWLAVLEVHNLGIRFGGLQALEAVTFKAEEYEIVGLMGPNGAGKTTAFNLITGFYEPTTGTVSYRGRDITPLRPEQRAALGIGRTFQQVGLVRTMTVLENLLTSQHARIQYGVGGGVVGSPVALSEESKLKQRAMEVLDYMGLAHLAHVQLGGLPYGTLKMIEASAVLATDPDLLLLDEPSAGMSPEESHDFGDLLLNIRKELGVTIVMIEHHVPMVVAVCDYIYVLNFGRLLAEGLPAEIQSHPEVISAYFGEEDTYGAA